MNSTVKKQIFQCLEVFVVSFVTFAVIDKLFWEKSDWLTTSSLHSLYWGLGAITANVLKNKRLDGIDLFLAILSLAAIIFLGGAFVFGVVLNSANWLYIIGEFLYYFGISLLIRVF